MHAFKFTFGFFLGFFFYYTIPGKPGRESVGNPDKGGGAGILGIPIGGKGKFIKGGGSGGGNKFDNPGGGGGKLGNWGSNDKLFKEGGGGKIGIPIGGGGGICKLVVLFEREGKFINSLGSDGKVGILGGGMLLGTDGDYSDIAFDV